MSALIQAIRRIRVKRESIDSGYAILISALDNYSSNRHLYQMGQGGIHEFCMLEKAEIISGLEFLAVNGNVKSLLDRKIVKVSKTKKKRPVAGRYLAEAHEEILGKGAPIVTVYSVYDAVMFLRNRGRSPYEISQSLGSRAFNLVREFERRNEPEFHDDRNSENAYRRYLGKLINGIAHTYGVNLEPKK